MATCSAVFLPAAPSGMLAQRDLASRRKIAAAGDLLTRGVRAVSSVAAVPLPEMTAAEPIDINNFGNPRHRTTRENRWRLPQFN